MQVDLLSRMSMHSPSFSINFLYFCVSVKQSLLVCGEPPGGGVQYGEGRLEEPWSAAVRDVCKYTHPLRYKLPSPPGIVSSLKREAHLELFVSMATLSLLFTHRCKLPCQERGGGDGGGWLAYPFHRRFAIKVNISAAFNCCAWIPKQDMNYERCYGNGAAPVDFGVHLYSVK